MSDVFLRYTDWFIKISIKAEDIDNCGNKMPTGCNRRFLLHILLFAQHVSGTTMSIIRSNNICNKNHLLHLFGTLFPHINDDAVQNHIKN